MDRDKIINFIKDVPGGRFFRLRYTSNMPVKAKYQNQGITILKVVNITTRTGVRYSAIAEPSNEEVSSKNNTNNWVWIIPNRLKYNSNTKSQYLVTAPTKGSNAKSTYLLCDSEGCAIRNEEEIKEYIIDSYWRKEVRPINTININNILLISGKK